eukprot:GHVU01085478.1.p1 GENE.GHVU01085478.1~~GHVU01085478.1.p1  ORF type:complete len:114 (-),score=4.59 GHVU01085478.1:29-370(-)
MTDSDLSTKMMTMMAVGVSKSMYTFYLNLVHLRPPSPPGGSLGSHSSKQWDQSSLTDRANGSYQPTRSYQPFFLVSDDEGVELSLAIRRELKVHQPVLLLSETGARRPTTCHD